jgi:putative endopeptidase
MLFTVCSSFAQNTNNQTQPLDRANMDPSCEPCKDFYRFANGGWVDKNPVPAAYSNWGSFSEINQRNENALKSILEESAAMKEAPRGSAVQLVGDFFASGMDSAQADADGLNPLTLDLAGINKIKNLNDLQAMVTYFHLGLGAPIFGLSSQQDFKNSEETIASLDQSGITVPDRDYYVKDDERYESARKEYTDYMVKMFTMLGDGEKSAKANAATVMKIETRLAKASMPRVEMRDPKNVYHRMSLAEVKKLTPAWNWVKYLTDVRLNGVSSLNVSSPKFMKEVNAMLKQVPLKDWKTYLRWQMIDQASQYLSKDFVDAHFRFHGTVLNGQKELLPRWKRVSRMTDNLLGEALGQAYVAKTFASDAKARAKKMVDNLLAAYRERINTLSWMSDETKKKALEKLGTFVPKIGYTDKWKSYDGLRIDRGSYIQNIIHAAQHETRRQLDKIGKPLDRTEWFMTPPTVNAYYNPPMNEIVFPAGIMQPPFFDPNADDAVNYGGMGAVIGHEITHGFDDQGRKFDAKGNLADWWTKDDEERFTKLADVVVDQFNNYVAIDSLTVNGKFTLGENIADLGGLAIAFAAYKKSLEGKPAPPKIDGFTGEQRFFLAWAQMWRRNYTPQNLRQRIVTDPHAPSVFRCNGPISNMSEFFEAFGCKDSDPMVRAKVKQVRIW